MNLAAVAEVLVEKLRENDAGGSEQAQIMCVAEEAGEFVGAMRRWRGMARRAGTEQEAKAELADLIITSYVMAAVMGWSVEEITSAKLEKIMTRGWKEPAPTA